MEYLLFVLLILYLLPFTIAAGRAHPHLHALLAANLLTGWTGIGWIVTLLWAVPASFGRPFAWLEPRPPPASPRRRRAAFTVVAGERSASGPAPAASRAASRPAVGATRLAAGEPKVK